MIIIFSKARRQIKMDFQDEKSAYTPPQNQHNFQIGQDIEGVPQNYDNYSPNEQKASQLHEGEKQEKQEEEAPTGCCKFFRLEFYEQFFKATQQEVLQRIKLSFIPVKPHFIDCIRANPDFYGPFWILTTIIFLLSSTSNLARYFYNFEKDEYIFKLEYVKWAVMVVYMFGFGFPTLLFFGMKFMGLTRLSLPDIICLYGYSFSCFIVIFLLCIIPVEVIQWLLMAYGMINTIAFLVLNIKDYLEELQKPKMYVIFGIISVVQISLFLIFKLIFFSLIYDTES